MSFSEYLLNERNKNGGKVINLMEDAFHEGTLEVKEKRKLKKEKPLHEITEEEAEISLQITKSALELLLAYQKADKMNMLEIGKLREEKKRIKKMEEQINSKVSVFDKKSFKDIRTL